MYTWLLYFVGFHPIAMIGFRQATLTVEENTGLSRPSLLLLSDRLQNYPIPITVFTTDGSATGA